METEVKCPSGLEGRIRSLKVKDESIFTDAKLLKSGKLIQELCRKCWVETTNLGIYDFPDGNVVWPKILQGDTFWIFLQIRRASYGDIYEFSEQCDSCRSAINWEIDLSKDLPMQSLPEESKEAHRNDTFLETKLEDGRLVHFRLLYAEDDQHITNLQRSRKMLRRYAAIAARLMGVEGIGNNHFDLIRFVEEMDSGEADLLEEKMEAQDCGVDTDIVVTCGQCLYDQVITLPFEVSFFQKRKKKSVESAARRKQKTADSQQNTNSERNG